MTQVSLADVASYLPEDKVSAEYFAHYAKSDRLANNIMFKAPAFRHHVARGETAPDMIERAAQPLLARHGARTLRDVDVLITHTQLLDSLILGSSGEVAKRLGANPEWLIDLHNGGCASFVYMMKLASRILLGTDAKSALICNAQNAAGQLCTQSEVRKLAAAAVPGDGAGVGLLTKSDDSPILAIEARHYNEFAGEMVLTNDYGRNYWAEGEGQIRIGFTENSIAKVLTRGNRQVPEVINAVCSQIGVSSSDIDVLVTNQPNRFFLRNWGEAIQPRSYPNTFDQCGNLFGAAMPVTLDQEISAGRIQDGALVVLAGFAHAGDFAGAAAFQWRGRS
jgi:3-oxoacyl-[acyl-carrier-protein] synthase-3